MARAGKVDLRAFQQELVARLAAKTASEVESSRLGLACAGRHWLIRLGDAGEVLPIPQVASVPLTKPWFLGVSNIRGNLYGVVEFAGFLGHAAAAAGAASRLVLFGARAGDLRAGLVVPQVLGLRNLASLAPAEAATDARDWFGPHWVDGDGVHWQEIDLVRLAQDPDFLQVGV
jgi:twitching motility protein PilI